MRRFQAARHMIMGLLLIFCAYLFIQRRLFANIEVSQTVAYVIAAILVVYGLFRIWRGTADLREKDSDDYLT